MKIRMPLVRELSMLAIGAAGMFRELFLLPPKDLSLVRVGICLTLMMGPAIVLVWLRAKTPELSGQEQSSPSSGSSSSSRP